MKEKILFDDNWKFHCGDISTQFPHKKGIDYMSSKTERMVIGPAACRYNDNSDSFAPEKMGAEMWCNVTLPHDYMIEKVPSEEFSQAHGYFKYENAWYRKTFTLTEADKDKRITLYFEGVATTATVYVNGCLMKHNFCGYTPFEVDITDVALFDRENVIAVYTQCTPTEGWWYQGGGIYRHVWLNKTALVHTDLYGVYVNPIKTDTGWNVNVETTVVNSSDSNRNVILSSEICDESNNIVAYSKNKIAVNFSEKAVFKQEITVENPKIWDINSPNMYTLVTKIHDDADTDITETRFGFRTFSFDSEKGFILNGRQLKIKGVCAHQDYGITGKAVADNVHRYKIELIKEMGANAYRTSHYPHSEATMDALDENGILVMDETRWYESTDEGINQLETMIKRDRNHPSVILWSIGNEEPKHLTEQGRRIAKSMISAVRRLDTARPITTAVSNDPINSTVLDLVDVIGINYNLNQYDEIHSKYPNKPIVSTECCATGTTRGFYLDDNAERGFRSAYDKDTDNWFLGREKTWNFIAKRQWLAGCFQWIAFEHRGECEWPRLCSVSGAIDMFLQKKDAFYQNKSHWTQKPMVHILPHWNHSGLEGEIIKVWTYTNCDEVELRLNGTSLGSKKIDRYSHGEWNVPYQSGKLQAIGKINGEICCEDFVETTGKAVGLKLTLDNTVEYANGRDLAILTCTCVDENGREIPDAEEFISFYTNNLGNIVGTGSCISDHIPPKCPDRQMYAGRCSVAVRVGSKAGMLKVYAKCKNLDKAVITIPLK